MKKKITTFMWVVIIVSVQNFLFSQTNQWIKENASPTSAKLYLHTDREFYYQGDSVWFKAYYVDGQSHKPLRGAYNMQLEIVNRKNEVITQQIIPLFDGTTIGNIKFPKSVQPNTYILKASTNFLNKIGEEVIFKKKIIIANPKESLLNKTYNEVSNEIGEILILPEGGFLLSNKMNTIAIKAMNKRGIGIPIKAVVLNQKNEVIKKISTTYKGMGSFKFIPKEEDAYSIVIDSRPDLKYEIKNILKEGIKFEFFEENSQGINFRIVSNSEKLINKEYQLAALNRGKVIFLKKFILRKDEMQIRIHNKFLPAGINRFVLLDSCYKPISERLYFSDNIKINRLKLNLSDTSLNLRSLIKLNIKDDEDFRINSNSSLSISVVNNKATGKIGPNVNFLSHLLVSSELRGVIESPTDYFIDEKNMSKKQKLDLLMLTQGWSNYIWNIIPDKLKGIKMKQENGLTIKGKVYRNLGKRTLDSGNATISIKHNNVLELFQEKIDENGFFSITNLYFTDTASLVVNARNRKGKSRAEILLYPLFTKTPELSEAFLNKPHIPDFNLKSINTFKERADNSLHNFLVSEGSITLDEFVVRAKKINNEDDGHFRIYGSAENSFKLKDDAETYFNVFDFLAGRVSGVVVTGDNISIRGGTAPLYLIDGVEITAEDAKDLPMSEIDRIEVLKYIHEIAMFGSRGANGVVSILTKKGLGLNAIQTSDKEVVKTKLIGYAPYKAFYSPSYVSEENVQSKVPDHRITLYWNPKIITKNGEAEVMFYTSDDCAKYNVYVEGITNNGVVCLGKASFIVK